MAVAFLKKRGYKIITTDYHTKLGQIDIIARDKGIVCFIEVKLRRSVHFGLPYEAVGRNKQRKIAKTALGFLKRNALLTKPARFDVISILLEENPQIDLFKNAFSLDTGYIY